MKSVVIGTIFLCLIGLLTGCTLQVMPSGATNIDSNTSESAVGGFNDRMKTLADQLNKNAVGNNLSKTFIVTSFTNLDNLNDTTAVGRLIAENLMHGMQLNKWQILEVRLSRDVDVTADGEFSLTRDVSKLKDEYKISGIVTGTYSLAEGNVTINARIIDVNTGIIISSAQTYIPVVWLPDISQPKEKNHKGMKIVNDGIK